MSRPCRRFLRAFGLFVSLCIVSACHSDTIDSTPINPSSPSTEKENVATVANIGIFEVLESREHDASYFTQGFLIDDDTFYETSGLYGQSRVKKYSATNNVTLKERAFERRFFAEGLTKMGPLLYMLTWKENTAFVLDAETFDTIREHTYDTEGWGLTHDGTSLIMSDGSATLWFRDPDSFAIVRQLGVTLNGVPLRQINELEFAQGLIWANIFQRNIIVAIHPTTGHVVTQIDLDTLSQPHRGYSSSRVLNGIAYDAKREAFWITGKLWPKTYLVQFKSSLSAR